MAPLTDLITGHGLFETTVKVPYHHIQTTRRDNEERMEKLWRFVAKCVLT
ncbi:hypothetical protein LMG24238_02290 [Paraburkholderia sediminicola]|uniref:Uncharacterized protein n=1 Tax=Paraburkholderia sediminicola TaxID=458836 RepID=A0A6J5AMG9_9BURK|nr:hypothetical protein LMG24238_02290 [Paraburkholderia sediminicola]